MATRDDGLSAVCRALPLGRRAVPLEAPCRCSARRELAAKGHDVLALASTPTSGKRGGPAQVSDNFRQAQPLALVVKRSMAAPPMPSTSEPRPPARGRTRPPARPASPAGRAGRADPEIDLAIGPVDVPRRHLGMAVAHALLSQRERLSVTPVRAGEWQSPCSALP